MTAEAPSRGRPSTRILAARLAATAARAEFYRETLIAERQESGAFATAVRIAAREIHRAIPAGDWRRVEQRSGEIVSRSDRRLRQLGSVVL